MKTIVITIRDPEQERLERIRMEQWLAREREEQKQWEMEHPNFWAEAMEQFRKSAIAEELAKRNAGLRTESVTSDGALDASTEIQKPEGAGERQATPQP